MIHNESDTCKGFHDLTEIRGNMSMLEVAERFGVNTQYLCTELGIPISDARVQLGRLQKKYIITRAEIRRAIYDIRRGNGLHSHFQLE